MEVVHSAQSNLLVRFKARAGQRSGILGSITDAITLYESMPADCLVKAVRRNLDDTEAGILYKKRLLELRKAPSIVI